MDALILSCGTGGGHNSAAEAIREELVLRGDHAVVLNPYDLRSGRVAGRIDKAYISPVQKAPAVFGVVYKLGELYRRLPFRSPVYFLNGRMVSAMEAYLKQNHFDIVIMTHLFPAEILTQMKGRGIKIPKTIYVATDYTCIPFTEETDCDAYVVPHEKLVAEFEGRGIDEAKIFPLGIPVRRIFSSQISQEEARQRLGFEEHKKYILVSGGSIGAGKLEKVIKLLERKSGDEIRVVVICGNNRKLYQRLGRKYGGKIELIRHTDEMAVYLRACDLYLTKPGGLSSTEAAVMRIPIIHLPPIPGCETKNARFFSRLGMSYRLKLKAGEVAQLVSRMEDVKKWEGARRKEQKNIRQDAAMQICELAGRMTDTA